MYRLAADKADRRTLAWGDLGRLAVSCVSESIDD